MKPVHVQPIILSCMVGFEHYLAQIIIMTMYVVRSKVKVTVCTSALCLGFGETCLCPAHDFVMRGMVSKFFGISNYDITRQSIECEKSCHWLKGQGHSPHLTLCIGFCETGLCPDHNFVLHVGI